MPAQRIRRTDAGEHQEVRRIDRSRRDDDLASGAKVHRPAAAPRHHADGATALEHQLADFDARHHGEIAADSAGRR